MNRTPMVAALTGLLLLAGCTYDGMRNSERQKCAAMPQSLGERCFQRTQDTSAEYRTKREELRRSIESRPADVDGKELDPRYKDWIP